MRISLVAEARPVGEPDVMAIARIWHGKQKDAPMQRALICVLEGGNACCAQAMSSFFGICCSRLTMLKWKAMPIKASAIAAQLNATA